MKLLIFIPLIAGYLTSLICPVKKNTGKNIKFRPKPYVFAIVWPILYLMIGYSWYLAHSNNIFIDLLFIINTLICCLWLVFYNCMSNKIYGLYDLFLLQLSNLVLMIYLIQNKKYNSVYLILPYMIWIIFAILMNFTSIIV